MKVGVTYHDDKRVGPYCKALEAAGLEPVPMKPGDAASLDGLGGLLVSGGPDLDPAMYGEAPDGSEEPLTERDAFESTLLRDAIQRDLPVLCICRGMQLFNVVHGGSLYQHLSSTEVHRQRKVDDAHDVTVKPGSKLEAAIGGGGATVNSRHHQAVKNLGERLIVTARADDGVIEAIERPDLHWAVAVQWHPEDRVETSERDRRLFLAFARAVAGGRG